MYAGSIDELKIKTELHFSVTVFQQSWTVVCPSDRINLDTLLPSGSPQWPIGLENIYSENSSLDYVFFLVELQQFYFYFKRKIANKLPYWECSATGNKAKQRWKTNVQTKWTFTRWDTDWGSLAVHRMAEFERLNLESISCPVRVAHHHFMVSLSIQHLELDDFAANGHDEGIVEALPSPSARRRTRKLFDRSWKTKCGETPVADVPLRSPICLYVPKMVHPKQSGDIRRSSKHLYGCGHRSLRAISECLTSGPWCPLVADGWLCGVKLVFTVGIKGPVTLSLHLCSHLHAFWDAFWIAYIANSDALKHNLWPCLQIITIGWHQPHQYCSLGSFQSVKRLNLQCDHIHTILNKKWSTGMKLINKKEVTEDEKSEIKCVRVA